MPSDTSPEQLILASASPYRRQLMARLAVAFDCIPADVDETCQPGEPAPQLASRLALLKAAAVARENPHAIVIGSDQVAVVNGRIVGKPADRQTAAAQLRAASGQSMDFYTAVCVLSSDRASQSAHLDTTRVFFLPLNDNLIDAYLASESALDCAGSFKSEGLGIALLEKIQTRDPTALIGLPLIWLASTLRALGLAIP